MNINGDVSAARGTDQDLSLACVWDEESIPLKALAASRTLPILVRVTKGQYRNIGVSKAVNNDLYVNSSKTIRKVLAEGVKIKDGKSSKLLATDQRFSLPVSYRGWFELLSEDGKAVKALSSVIELVRQFPESCLVRENIKAYIPNDGTMDSGVDKTRVVQAGEILKLKAEVHAPISTPKGIASMRALKCYDSKGDPVYLSYEQTGVFSQVAGPTNISGVHSIKAILDKFRLPLLVRLVHGIIPTKVERNFTGIFRLTAVYSDDTVFVCPLKKDSKMIPISTRESIKMAVATNWNILRDREDVRYHRQRCSQMIASYMNSIHVLVAMPDPTILAKAQEDHKLKSQRHASSPDVRTSMDPEEEDILFDEIGDIYRYVREGGVVPEPRRRPFQTPSKQRSLVEPTAKAKVNSHLEKTREASAPKVTSQIVSDQGDVLSNNSSKDSTGNPGERCTWEEPIYEHVNRIQSKKKDQRFLEQTIVFTRPPHGGEDVKRRHSKAIFSSEENTSVSPPPPPIPARCPIAPTHAATNIPVANLRQVMKHGQDMDDEDGDSDPDLDGPPIPPKTFSEQVATRRPHTPPPVLAGRPISPTPMSRRPTSPPAFSWGPTDPHAAARRSIVPAPIISQTTQAYKHHIKSTESHPQLPRTSYTSPEDGADFGLQSNQPLPQQNNPLMRKSMFTSSQPTNDVTTEDPPDIIKPSMFLSPTNRPSMFGDLKQTSGPKYAPDVAKPNGRTHPSYVAVAQVGNQVSGQYPPSPVSIPAHDTDAIPRNKLQSMHL